MIKKIALPINPENPPNIQLGDRVELYGKLYTGRDAALPKLVESIKKGRNPLDLTGSAIMHTAVSDAGISPTTSNKVEIEGNMAFLSKCGVKMHIGKGRLNQEIVEAISRFDSVFVVTPPAAALLKSKVIKKKVVAFPEEGIEAIYQLEVDAIPGIVSAANGKTLN
jgi:fumarate hydratase subunit beta